MKVMVIKRGLPEKIWRSGEWDERDIIVHYCGYLEVNDPFETDLWDLCNWTCWSQQRPKECEHLLIGFCNSDVAYYINGEWYSHDMHVYDTFTECYNDMTRDRYSKHFYSLWPIDSGFPRDHDKIEKITPANEYKFTDKLEGYLC